MFSFPLKIVFTSDAFYISFVVLLGVSNGYVGNIATMFGPKVVEEADAEVTASVLVAVLVVGCGLGSVVSAYLVQLL